ncbi:hypothetical protein H257_13082 [Aphanomyces astaci]|uniref:Uncharacterized protein n=1 Tax=Aphanomyces astaci TaxID=112090 RepID=W4FVW4_APHAT|nr:hypothetical protein H257_13082 [Aphanomyces astaci]ETV71622.1 hypothetical protein H257_13082 [Aphanomyces astaci]|eukprot:XP_009838810.1 hypothetical protein H257_13082 [Aphanomyces astaci]
MPSRRWMLASVDDDAMTLTFEPDDDSDNDDVDGGRECLLSKVLAIVGIMGPLDVLVEMTHVTKRLHDHFMSRLRLNRQRAKFGVLSPVVFPDDM